VGKFAFLAQAGTIFANRPEKFFNFSLDNFLAAW
jgi:hypothetical protein